MMIVDVMMTMVTMHEGDSSSRCTTKEERKRERENKTRPFRSSFFLSGLLLDIMFNLSLVGKGSQWGQQGSKQGEDMIINKKTRIFKKS
jgi:hypothetical protein